MASFAALIAAVSLVYDKIGNVAAGILLMIFSFVGLWLSTGMERRIDLNVCLILAKIFRLTAHTFKDRFECIQFWLLDFKFHLCTLRVLGHHF
jgi:hypothetical protein